jgi:ElaB/YqjD/DUF883 family membrane-anchored ribosome-binding protein
MNNEPFTTPSPELKQHGQDLKDHATEGAKNIKQDAQNIAQDVRKQASQGVQALRDEAGNRVQDAKGKANELIDAARSYATEHPFSTFGYGVLTGLIIAAWRRK